MERVDLRQIEYFVAVAEELHFGRAAERLYIAQPSLSKQIRRLEAQVGVQLLYRTSRRVELTPAGTALLREGRRAIGHAQRALSAAREQAGELLTVGFYGSAGSALLPQVLAAYRASQPHVHVVLKELGLSHVDQIASGEVHVAFTRLRPGEANLEIEIINDEPRVVALPVDHGSRPATPSRSRISATKHSPLYPRLATRPGTTAPRPNAGATPSPETSSPRSAASRRSSPWWPLAGPSASFRRRPPGSTPARVSPM